mgnify:CR=1 FL=1
MQQEGVEYKQYSSKFSQVYEKIAQGWWPGYFRSAYLSDRAGEASCSFGIVNLRMTVELYLLL